MDDYTREASAIISKYTGLSLEEAREIYNKTRGMAFRDQLAHAGVPGPRIEDAAREFESRKTGILKAIRIDGAVKTIIRYARNKGLKVVLSTNNECRLVGSIPELRRVFDRILCHDPETGVRKGEDHIRILQEDYNVTPDMVLFIGDSDYDIELYSALGVKTIKTSGLWREPERIMRILDSIEACSRGR